MQRKLLSLFLRCCLLWAVAGSLPATAQRIAVKNNLLYDLTGTPNLGIEVALGHHHTAQLFYGLNPWKKGDGRTLRHWQLMPEYRYWTCSKFNGHFFGVHAMGGEYRISQVDAPFGLFPKWKDHTYTGWNAGVGVTYGYQWILRRHWNVEASIGVGYNYIKYKRYDCVDCGRIYDDSHLNYFGPTKLALSVLYVF